MRGWAKELGVKTYIGSSGRVFPLDRKAAPLLRRWVHRLHTQGVHFHMHHRWLGFADDGGIRFLAPGGEVVVRPDAIVLALGGGSWTKLGSDGAWVASMEAGGIEVNPLQPNNCGFNIHWSNHLRSRFAGTPLKPVIAYWQGVNGELCSRQGECVISDYGIESSLIYAASADLRDACTRDGFATLTLDLAPHLHAQTIATRLVSGGSRSLSERLRRRVGMAPVHVALLHETLDTEALRDPACIAKHLKALPLRLERPRPIDEAISSAGGVSFTQLDAGLMVKQRPGLFCAGEMLDWEAPTGGYLLQACMASGRVAGKAAAASLSASLS